MVKSNLIGRYSLAGLKKAAMTGVAFGVLGSVAAAQVSGPQAPLKLKSDYFGYSAGVSTRVTYTDNVHLAREGLKESEYILSTGVTGGAIISTPRVTAIAMGDLDFSYLFDQSDLVVNQNLGATSTFTAADNWLYVDISGQTSRQLVGDNARFSANPNSARGQRANVHSYSASPYIYHRMADQSSVELRYRFSQVFVDDTNTSFSIFNGSSINDSSSQEIIANYNSGGLSERVQFGLTAYGNRTKEDGALFIPDFDYEQGSVSGNAQLALSPSLSLSGAIGYDEIETAQAAALFFNDDDLSGFYWRAGFTAKPNRRSSIRLEYGERYNDGFIDADIFYELSKRLVFSAGASRVLRSRAQGTNASFRTTQTQTLDFADRLREGEEISPRGLISAANQFAGSLATQSGQAIGVSVSDQAYAALTGTYDRTQVTLSGNYSDRDFGYRQTEYVGMSFNVNRQISRDLSAYAGVNYRRSDSAFDVNVCEANPLVFGFDVTDPLFNAMTDCADLAASNGVTNTILGRLGASMQIYQNVSAFAEISHTKRFSEVDALEYDENTVTAGLTLEF